ncbi:hypothetical protein LEQ_0075c [Ligilactobacillus equi DPC 6820]|uniref:Lipoprotein n=2 Tax=Ligilactobacillus equi TaxID=137357 RepID=V7HV52_9LACO|nr:hypothetical protein LEQ_0075c [Ligilactobacillus equi DPC 6820]
MSKLMPRKKITSLFVFLIVIVLSACITYFGQIKNYTSCIIYVLTGTSVLVPVIATRFAKLDHLYMQSDFFKRAKRFGQDKTIMVKLTNFIALILALDIGLFIASFMYIVVVLVQNQIALFIINVLWLSWCFLVMLGVVEIFIFLEKIRRTKNINNVRITS